MQLLPLIVVFILAIFCVLAFFAFITYLYFRIKRKTYFIDEDLSPDDRVNDPYIEMMPLKTGKGMSNSSYKNKLNINKNLSKMKNSTRVSTPNALFNVAQLSNRLSRQTTNLDDQILPQQKFQFISKIINYRKDRLELFSYEAQTISNKKSFINMNWRNTYKIQPIKKHIVYRPEDEGFIDLLDIFKLEKDDFCSIKFVVELIVKDCTDERLYYIDDLPKTERVQTISQIQFQVLKKQLYIQ